MDTNDRPSITHTTGYHVWLYGDCYWHRSMDRAVDRAIRAANWCSDPQVIDVATGEQVY